MLLYFIPHQHNIFICETILVNILLLILNLVSLQKISDMSKKEKLVARLLSRPKDFSYDEAKSLLGFLGFEERHKGKTSGSRVEYIKDKDTILLHKPHPSGVLKPYQIKQIIETLKTLKLI